MGRISEAEKQKWLADYADDPKVQALVSRLLLAESLLDRSLYEFGSELRGEIETYLGVKPLLPRM